MPRKRTKKVKESNFNVTLTIGSGPSAEKVEKTISAASADQAMAKAKQGQAGVISDVQISQTGMGSAAPTQGSKVSPTQAVSQTTPKTTGMQNRGPDASGQTMESKKKKRSKKSPVKEFKLTSKFSSKKFEYPYSIGLPQAFDKLIEATISKTDAATSQRFSRLYITIPDRKNMEKFVENLVRKAKGRNAQLKEQSTVVIKGIMESIEK